MLFIQPVRPPHCQTPDNASPREGRLSAHPQDSHSHFEKLGREALINWRRIHSPGIIALHTICVYLSCWIGGCHADHI